MGGTEVSRVKSVVVWSLGWGGVCEGEVVGGGGIAKVGWGG